MPSSYARNVNPYLHGLNEDDYIADIGVSDEQLREDLDLFTNTNFYDIDAGQTTDFQAPPVKPETYEPTSATSDVSPILDDFSTPGNLDFLSGDFAFTDFSSTSYTPTVPAFPEPLNLQPIQPSPQTAYPSHVPQHQPGYVPNTGAPIPPQRIARGGVLNVGGVVVGEKRKAEQAAVTNSTTRYLGMEDQARMAAEEDKRKRNTAASARFRVKKKQREQALEKTAKEMADKVTMLEGRISALETENKWLKSLVTEKHGGGKDDILKLLEKFSAAKENGKGGAESTSEDEGSSRGSVSSGSSGSSSSIANSITAAPTGSETSSKKARKSKD